MAWKELCHSKSIGGLGFRDVKMWNVASLGKQVWAIAKKKDSVWVRWVHH